MTAEKQAGEREPKPAWLPAVFLYTAPDDVMRTGFKRDYAITLPDDTEDTAAKAGEIVKK